MDLTNDDAMEACNQAGCADDEQQSDEFGTDETTPTVAALKTWIH